MSRSPSRSGWGRDGAAARRGERPRRDHGDRARQLPRRRLVDLVDARRVERSARLLPRRGRRERRRERRRHRGYGGLLAPEGSHQGDVQTLTVAEPARGRGIGRALLNALLAEAGRRGADEVFLEVRAGNGIAQGLYASLGFERIAVRPHYYQPDGEDAWVMRRTAS
nr:GNAT family N-acetyltransferase [Pseudolysinimonas kribbensis]